MERIRKFDCFFYLTYLLRGGFKVLKKSMVLILVFCLTITLALSGCSKQTDTASQGDENQVAEQISEAGTKDAGDVQKQESDKTAPNPAKTRKSSDALVVGYSDGFKGQFISAYNSSVCDTNVVRVCFSPLLRYNNKNEIENILVRATTFQKTKRLSHFI